MTEKQHSQTKQTQNKYRFVMKKGSGAFADVIQAENIRTGQMVAIKRMKQTYKNIEQIQSLREIQSLRQLRHHPNIVQLLEILFDKQTGKLALVFELLSHDMYQTIRHRKQQLPVNQVKWYMFQVINGLRGLHQAGYFHRDVKPENVLIKRMQKAESWTGDIIKLSDLGSARQIGSQQPYTEYISTRWYRPPETLLSDGVYGQEMDIFGVGCVLYEMIELRPIFPGKDELDQIQRIHAVMGTPTPQLLKQLRAGAKNNPIKQEFQPQQGCGVEKLMSNPPKGAAKLIEAMLTYDPKERITAEQAMASEYFEDIPEVIKEIRNAGFIDETYLNQMEAAWSEVRGVKAPAGKQKTTMRAPMNSSYDRSPREQNINTSGSFSPPKKHLNTNGVSNVNTINSHKVKKTKMKQSTIGTMNGGLTNLYPKPEQIGLQVKPLVTQPPQLPQLKKKYIYKVGK